MKKKLFLVALMVLLFVCAFAMAVSAESLEDFINVELTLDDNSKIEAYLKKGTVWSGYQGYDRVTIYTDYTDKSKTLDWSRVRVFDGRSSTIHTYKDGVLTDTGAFAQTLLGYPTNVSGVTHFYYPQGSIIVADNSFNNSKNGWSLEYLYIPKSVKIIGTGSCLKNTKLTTVEFEQGSLLEEIKGSVFKECSALESINLQDTRLKKIGGSTWEDDSSNAFRSCTSLTSVTFPETLESVGYNAFYLSGLSQTLVLPNSVTYVGPGSFLSTKIETLVLGDGPIEIGNNFVGDFDKTTNAFLKKVFIPSEATFITANQTWFKCVNQVEFYVIGKDCTNLINTLLSDDDSTKYMSIGKADSENATAYDGIIIENYSPCEAFYNGNHAVGTFVCERCDKVIYCDNPEHNLIVNIQYVDYLSEGEKSTVCLDCGSLPLITKAPALFTCVGYSAPEFGASGIAVGFTVNNGAVTEYQTVTGKAVRYGVFAVLQDRLGDNEIFGEDGAASAGVINADITNYDFEAFELKIVGFTDEQKDIKLAMGAYVAVTDGETTEYSYMQDDTKGKPVGEYYFVSYNDVISKTPSENIAQ